MIIGIFLLVDGVLAIFGAVFGRGEGRGLLALIGVLSAIAGLVLIKQPFETLVVFAIIVGIWFVVGGIVRFVAAIAEPVGRGGNILVALVDLGIGVVILAWPDLGLATFAVLVGIGLILRGLLFIYAGWQIRKLGHAAAPSAACRARWPRRRAARPGSSPRSRRHRELVRDARREPERRAARSRARADARDAELGELGERRQRWAREDVERRAKLAGEPRDLRARR